MIYDSYQRKMGNGQKLTVQRYAADHKIHIVLIAVCAVLLLGDFLSTSLALSAVESGKGNPGVSVSELNPIMAYIVNDPIVFLVSKMLILAEVVLASYVLKNYGAYSYLPSIIVCGFYLFVNINNINALTYVFFY